jgi:hypothetical protein
MLDMPSFPRAVTVSESENSERQAQMTRAITSIAGKESDLKMALMGVQWQNASRTTMLKIKNRNTLPQRLKDMKETAEHLRYTLESHISNVLVISGYSETLSRDWALDCLLLRMSFKGVDSYINLHSHILEPQKITAYTSNLNTAQQELLHLHETYAHAYMQEIQYKIKHGDIKSTRKVAL